jgi:signal transduction histidine kinase
MNLAAKKTNFVTNVSHELKTPLTSIRMFAEILKEKRQTDEKKKNKYLEVMVSETERLTRLINNVLDFSKIKEKKKSYNKKDIDCVELCNEIFQNHKERLINNGFIFNFIPKNKSLIINADVESMKQVILNLISNAEKYSIEKKEINLSVYKNDSNVIIEIQDHGIGIPAKYSKKIFKEFFRVDDSLATNVSGTGLGLTIAQKIINDHDGNIVYKPGEKEGSIFQIILPVK